MPTTCQQIVKRLLSNWAWRECARIKKSESFHAVVESSYEAFLAEGEFMGKRMVLMLSVVLAVLTTLGFIKFRQVQSAMQAGAGFQPPPEAVTSIRAQQ